MYAYVDETGNTGAKLLDDNQPLFITAALMTRSDFDSRFGAELRSVAQSLGVDELHAGDLGVAQIETIAGDLLKILRKAGPTFFLARVEKRYVLASKIVDTIFDSGENRAVAWHVYNSRPLRLILVFKIAYLLNDSLSQQFWDALLEKNDGRAHAAMAGFCAALLDRVEDVVDQRSREIIGEALEWAAANPTALEFVYADKVGRRSHLPNMVGFGNLLSGIEMQSNVWGRPVDVIRHDRQHEFKSSLEFWHSMYSNASAEVVHLPLGEKMVLRKIFGSRLEISAAKDSAGIQAIDVILWLFSRSLRGNELPRHCKALLDYVFRRARQDDFSFAGVGAATEEMILAIEDQAIPHGRLEQAYALRSELEGRRQAGMAAFAREQAAALPKD